MSVNVVFVDEAYQENRIFDIEYFLLHEMRRIYQNIQVEKFKTNRNIISDSYILKWIRENKNYIKALDGSGNENIDYFKQDCELDAYAYSVINQKYFKKYNQNLFVPDIYRRELKEVFDSAVQEFMETLNIK